jgi:hypothetical protein
MHHGNRVWTQVEQGFKLLFPVKICYRIVKAENRRRDQKFGQDFPQQRGLKTPFATVEQRRLHNLG